MARDMQNSVPSIARESNLQENLTRHESLLSSLERLTPLQSNDAKSGPKRYCYPLDGKLYALENAAQAIEDSAWRADSSGMLGKMEETAPR
jgi:hypothetical protein